MMIMVGRGGGDACMLKIVSVDVACANEVDQHEVLPLLVYEHVR